MIVLRVPNIPHQALPHHHGPSSHTRWALKKIQGFDILESSEKRWRGLQRHTRLPRGKSPSNSLLPATHPAPENSHWAKYTSTTFPQPSLSLQPQFHGPGLEPHHFFFFLINLVQSFQLFFLSSVHLLHLSPTPVVSKLWPRARSCLLPVSVQRV